MRLHKSKNEQFKRVNEAVKQRRKTNPIEHLNPLTITVFTLFGRALPTPGAAILRTGDLCERGNGGAEAHHVRFYSPGRHLRQQCHRLHGCVRRFTNTPRDLFVRNVRFRNTRTN